MCNPDSAASINQILETGCYQEDTVALNATGAALCSSSFSAVIEGVM